jgi:maltooligosyltrehalose trehalohydrolase
MATTMNLNEVGAFPSFSPPNNFTVRIGVYLPGIRANDGFQVVVRIIHRDDRFNAAVPTEDFVIDWMSGHPLDLWTKILPISAIAGTRFGSEGVYLYRFQLYFTPPGNSRQLITLWFTDPFARATDIGQLSAFTLANSPASFVWTDASY